MKPHVITNTHTCKPQTKVTQTTGTKHSNGTLFDWVIPKLQKIKVLCKTKTKKTSRPTAKKPYLIGCMRSYLEIAL